MPKSKLQKMKLVFLLELLRQQSDEQEPLTTRQILAYLQGRGISCDRRTLTRDMQDLNQNGFEVMSIMCGHEKGYYVDDRSFSVPELRILMDAVQGSNFISEKKSAELCDKIAGLGGSYRANLLRGNTVCFNGRKHRNAFVMYTVDALQRAFEQGKKVSFLYFDLDENKNKRFRRGGVRYVVDPVALVFSSDRYYLMTLNERQEGMRVYRVDRMERVELEPENANEQAAAARADVAAFTATAVKMFNGPSENVELIFDEDVLGAVYDRFGEDVPVKRLTESRCSVSVCVQISPAFWGWLFQFGDKIRLAGPGYLLDAYRERLKSSLRMLETGERNG